MGAVGGALMAAATIGSALLGPKPKAAPPTIVKGTISPEAKTTADLLQNKTAEYMTTPYEYYTGDRVAPLSAEELAGISAARNVAGTSGAAYGDWANLVGSLEGRSVAPAGRELAAGMTDIAGGSAARLGGLSQYSDTAGALASLQPGVALQGTEAAMGLAKTIPEANISGYMNPYLRGVLDPQLEDIARANALERNRLASQQAKVGAFGGSRTALQQAELGRNLEKEFGRASGAAYSDAYKSALEQYRKDQTYIPELYKNAQGMLTTAEAAQRSALDTSAAELAARAGVQGQTKEALGALSAVQGLENVDINRLKDLVTGGKAAYDATTAPLLTVGGLERSIEQAQKDFDYQQYVNAMEYRAKQLEEGRKSLSGGLTPGALGAMQGNAMSTSYQPSSANAITGGLASLAGAAMSPSGSKTLGSWFSGWGGDSSGGAATAPSAADFNSSAGIASSASGPLYS